jgi:hypothetical protein
MPYVETPTVKRARLLAEANPWLQQFGQTKDSYPWDGATACGHACWQFIILFAKGTRLSMDAISKLAGYPYHAKGATGVQRGLSVTETKRLIAALKLPYVLKAGLPWSTLNDYFGRGPVLYVTRYGSQPDWKGYTYRGVKANGSPNGYAKKAGRTQLTGFENGRHYVVTIGSRAITDAAGTVVGHELLRKDPNHGSPARPERPPYDIITSAQGKREYDDFVGVKYAFVPTRAL